MPTALRLLVLGLILGLVLAPTLPAEEKTHAAIKPSPRLDKMEKPDEKWMKRHEGFVAQAKKGHIDLLFMGDSITDAWGGEGHNTKANGAALFEKDFLPLRAANFGIGGDRTQHVLWRLQNGELDGIRPKVSMLMIGTNNSGTNSAEEIADGITAIVKEIKKQSPHTRTLLLGVFPRGEKPDNPQREKLAKVNQIIAKLDDGGKSVKYLDIGKKFMEPDGTITKEIMPDFLHLSPKGYQIWDDAVKKTILELLSMQ
jgi:lysophospholipase L1-like esterase